MKFKAISFIASGLTATLLLVGCKEQVKGRHFGEPFANAPKVTVGVLLQNPDQYTRQTVHVGGLIERQCPATGCWFFISDGGQSLKIELGDYLPRLPQNVGNRAEVEGELIKHGEGHLFIGTRVTFFPREKG